LSTIDARLNEAVEQSIKSRQGSSEFKRVLEFVRDARERGLVVQKKYDLPLIDTIGRTAVKEPRAGSQ
jgi:hypothetical protein